MPSGKETTSTSKKPNTERQTFQPPWVKDGGTQLKSVRRDSNTTTTTTTNKDDVNPLSNVQLRKTTVPTKEVQENGATKENTFKRPQLKKVPKKQESIQRNSSQDEDDLIIKDKFKIPQLKPVPPKEENIRKKENKLPETVQLRKTPLLQRTPTLKDEEIDRAAPATRIALVRDESMRKLHPPPPMPPAPPPPPKLPGMDRKPLKREQLEKLEQLKSRPKTRPDWTAMLKEIENKKNLKHVECNDRSQPLLPDTKDEHFLYESEKPNVHNELLKQIEGGLKLRKVKTNDRSKPILEGLRKFRRQMTIEEQIQKSQSMASIPPDEIIQDEVDEMDDIDKVRDDLQSTKQMLALELRNKEAQIRENKRLLAKIQTLEAELEKNNNEKNTTNMKNGGGGGDDKLIQSLKKDAELAQKTTKDMEKKYTEMASKFDTLKIELDDMKKQNQILEKKLQDNLNVNGKRHSLAKSQTNMLNGNKEELTESETTEDDSSDDDDDNDNEEKREKRMLRDIKHLNNKLRNFKNKQDNARKERLALKEILKKHQQEMKDEKKKYKSLKKEVDKMAALMKESEEDEEEEDSDDEEDDEETSEEETESEEESSEESESDDDDVPNDKKKTNLTKRLDRHEKILAALKKGNFMLKANAERLQDDLNKQKEETAGLQEDLDSVLAELG